MTDKSRNDKELIEYKEPDLSGVTPEIAEYIKVLKAMLEKPSDLGEAGGVAWLDLFARKTDEDGGQHMIKISVTERAANSEVAIRRLLKTLAYAKSIHMNPWPPDLGSAPVVRKSAPAPMEPERVPVDSDGTEKPAPRASARASVPAPAPAPTKAPATSGGEGDSGEVTVTVDSVKHQITPNGAHTIWIKGGRWKKHGVVAWEEAIPEEVEGWREWKVGAEYAPPPSMQKAVIHMEGDTPKKVTRFLAE